MPPGQSPDLTLSIEVEVHYPVLRKVGRNGPRERLDNVMRPIVVRIDFLDIDLQGLARFGTAHRDRPGTHVTEETLRPFRRVNGEQGRGNRKRLRRQ